MFNGGDRLWTYPNKIEDNDSIPSIIYNLY